MEVRIRKAVPEDAAAIVRILNPIIEARTFAVFDTPLTVETDKDEIIIDRQL